MNREALYLYKVSAVMQGKGSATVILLAATDEEAFAAADKELERHYIATPPVTEMVIEEKRTAGKGKGYVVETSIS
jgi:hypothetical protein